MESFFEIGLVEVAVDGAKAIESSVLLGEAFGDRRDGGPIDGGDLYVGKLLGQGDAPDARPGGDVQDVDRAAPSSGFAAAGQMTR